MKRSTAKFIFRAYEKIMNEPVSNILQSLEESQWYSLDTLRQLQQNKLKKLIHHCYQNVPYYRYLFDTHGINPKSIQDFNDFRSVPILTKDDFRRNMAKLYATNLSHRKIQAKTSGSTGLPLSFYKDPTTSAYHRAAIFRGQRWYGVDIGSLQARLWGVPLNSTQRNIMFFKDVLLNRFRAREVSLSPEVLFNFYSKMCTKKPEYLKGYPSMIYQFALFLRDNNINAKHLKLKLIECTAENIHDYYRPVIYDVFGLEPVSQHGCAEVGIISFQCPSGGHHIMADCIYEEYVDPFPPTAEDDSKEILVTDLHNYSLPILRYRLEDKVVPTTDYCSCRRGLPLFKKIIGRSIDFLLGTNGKYLHASIFTYIMKAISDEGGGIAQFKVYQTQLDQLLVMIVKDKHFENDILNYFTQQIHNFLGNDVQIKYEFVEHIPREISGKLRYFVSNL